MSSNQFQRVEKLTGECELIRYIGTKDNPTFQNSWVNFGSNREDAGFYRDKFNRVWLSGSVRAGTVPSTIFTVPVGYRPTAEVQYSSVDGTGTPSARIIVYTSGNVDVLSGSNTLITLDGISWRV
jgi:hypothetical protein